jgi:hypothetical protein
MNNQAIDWQSLVQALVIFLVAAGGALKAWQASRTSNANAQNLADNTKITAATNAKVDQNTAAQEATHLAINSKMDALLAVTKAASFAEGAKSETDKQAAAGAAKEVPK